MQWRRFITEKSGYFLDGNRIGNLVGTHTYSAKEILDRAFVICSIAGGAYLGMMNSSNKKQGVTFGASLGFLISHAVIIFPLITKRSEMKKGCEELKKEIAVLMQDSSRKEYANMMGELVQNILTVSSPKSASQTWGLRKRLLTELKDFIADQKNLKKMDNFILELGVSEKFAEQCKPILLNAANWNTFIEKMQELYPEASSSKLTFT